MTEVVIRNKEVLKTLERFSDEFFSVDGYDNEMYQAYSCEEDKSKGEYYCSEEFLKECLEGELIGAPHRHYAQPITKMVRVHPEIWTEYQTKVKYDFAAEIGAHTSALLSYYPPGGFVCWHTNYDASAYQVLFTWSDGNGYFRYYDKEQDKVVHIPDVKGWQCRHYYFAPENEPENLCWHAAYSGGERITLAYKFCGYGKNDPRDSQARELRDMLIEDIESA